MKSKNKGKYYEVTLDNGKQIQVYGCTSDSDLLNYLKRNNLINKAKNTKTNQI